MEKVFLTTTDENLALELVKFPLMFCKACFFGNPSETNGKINNGTITLIKSRGKRYGITNAHVIDFYRERLLKEPNLTFNIGSSEIKIEESIIDINRDLDLCTIALEKYSDDFLDSQSEIPCFFFEIDDFSLSGLKEGDSILLGGFIGDWKTRVAPDNVQFESYSIGGTETTEITSRSIRCELLFDTKKIALNNFDRSEPENYGGLSGGPVFLDKTLDSGITVFKLVGIIYEYMPIANSILIKPISFIQEDLQILDNS